MRKVAVIGVGTTSFRTRHPEKTYFELAFEATRDAIKDATISPEDINSIIYGIYNDLFERQFMPDIYIQDYLGLLNRPGTRVTCGGSTGAYAIRTAFMEIASGLSEITLCLGVEKALDCFDPNTGHATPEVLKAISYSGDMTWETPLGLIPATTYSLVIMGHIEKYGTPTPEQAAKVSVKNHHNAMGNPNAQSPMEITVEQVLNSRMITYPLKSLDCCQYSEGASAMILASEEMVKKLKIKNPVWISGVGAANEGSFIGKGSKEELGHIMSDHLAAKFAYKMAGIKNPLEEIDLVEIHDAFTFQEIITYEELGFAPRGQGGKLVDEGVVFEDGKLPVNLSGGLIGAGHAVGATNIYQGTEIVKQLQHRGHRQLKNPKRGLLHGTGGPVAAYGVVLIFEKN